MSHTEDHKEIKNKLFDYEKHLQSAITKNNKNQEKIKKLESENRFLRTNMNQLYRRLDQSIGFVTLLLHLAESEDDKEKITKMENTSNIMEREKLYQEYAREKRYILCWKPTDAIFVYLIDKNTWTEYEYNAETYKIRKRKFE